MKQDISLYLHIPFCAKKCNYCDFVSFAGCDADKMNAYVSALCREILSYAKEAKSYRVVSVFIGGGTPSILELSQMETIFHTLSRVWEISASAEITIELNPGTVDKKKLIGYRQLGINRLSIGLQTAQKNELQLLGRIHNYDQFVAAFHMAREAGFDNINVDLMMGLPEQTIESYRKTINRVLALKPQHISAYSLMIEEGTPFYQNEEIYHMLPDEETERHMYAYTNTVLEGHGYHRYEISNYALYGKQCRHNIVYWTDEAYLGLGLCAASYIGGYRFRNTSDMDAYMMKYGTDEMKANSIREDIECVDDKKHMEEYMFLGLRMMQGISRSRFQKVFQKDVYEIYKDVIAKWEAKGMIACDDEYVRLTKQGISISNLVMADFLL